MQALVRKWHRKQFDSSGVFIRAVGAATFFTVSTMGVFAKDETTVLPAVVVTGRQESDGSYKPEAVSSPKYSRPLKDIPQTITVIPKAVMQEQGSTTLREVLRNVPGISIQAGEGSVPAGDNLSLRGFNARTDIFIDGIRDFGGYARDPFNFEQIEVTKGPASSYAGRGSTGGSINMESKSPQLEAFANGTAGGGSQEYQRTALDVNSPVAALPGVAVRVNALYHDTDVSGRSVAHNGRWGVAPSLAFGLGTPTRVTFSYFHLDQNNVPDYGIPWVPDTNVPLAAYRNQLAPIDWSNFYGLKNRDYEKIGTDVATVKVEHEVSDGLSLRNQFRYGRTTRDSIITAPRFANVNSTDVTRTDWRSRDQVDTILANQTDATVEFATGNIQHTVVPGIEFVREKDLNGTRVKAGANSPNTSLYTPNWDDPYLDNIVPNGAKTVSTSNSVGVYAFDTLQLNEQWELNGGVRWDYFNLDFLAVQAPGGGTTTNLGRIDRTVSWQTGLVYKPLPNGSIYAGYGTSFNPSAEGLALSTTATATNNINSDPEESRSIELGTKWDLLQERLMVSAAIFRTDKTNARTEDPSVSTDTIVLDGKQKVGGLELGLAGNITDRWKAFAAYTFLTSEIEKSKNALEVGKELANTPNHTFSLWTTYQLPKNFEVGTGLKYSDSRFNSNINNRQAPGYLVADAMAAYKVNKDITLRLNVYNLAGTEYIESLSGGHAIPGAGRSFTVTSEFKF